MAKAAFGGADRSVPSTAAHTRPTSYIVKSSIAERQCGDETRLHRVTWKPTNESPTLRVCESG